MIRVESLLLELPGFRLGELNLDVEKGELFVLMGPTGSGKTLLLETIAGIYRPSAGRVIVAGNDVTCLPPGRRNVAIVYQEQALFPHMTVEQNIRFGAKYSRDSSRNEAEILSEVCELLEIPSSMLDRSAVTLSGGEKQKTELARALATSPEAILLDEPMASLDPPFRAGLRRELRRLKQTTSTTFLMTTHDIEDLISLGDRAAVLRDGLIEQSGAVEQLFDRPASSFVAGFLGMKNLFDADFCESGKALVGGLPIRHASLFAQGSGRIAIPPESIVLSTSAPHGTSARNVLRSKVLSLGRTPGVGSMEVTLETEGGTRLVAAVTASALRELGVAPGSSVYCSFKATAVHVF
jgi:molybdopterin-binding protein